MDLIEHFQENLNSNFENSQHAHNFIIVAKQAQKELYEKYWEGQFHDPYLESKDHVELGLDVLVPHEEN